MSGNCADPAAQARLAGACWTASREGIPSGRRDDNATKKVVGRKRHIVLDPNGRLLMVHMMPADISDSATAR